MQTFPNEVNQMTTIKDVANLAKVSPSTVSRVLANNQRISLKTQEKVRQAMLELGYQPNMIARSLIKRSSKTLGLVLSRSTTSAFTNPFFPEIIRGISTITQKFHYSLLLTTAESHEEEAKECLKMLGEKRVDGVLILASRVNDQLINQLSLNNYPFVVVGRIPDNTNYYSVNNDNVAAAYLATKHLLDLGHQRIAFLNGPLEFTFCQDRLAGYLQALQEYNLSPEPELIKHGNLSQKDGYELTEELFKTTLRPSAIFAIDDLMAIGAYQVIKNYGLQIPSDIAVVGFNDDPLASIIEPTLTTVKIPIYEMGATAARMIIQLLEESNQHPSQKILSSELIIRESSCKIV